MKIYTAQVSNDCKNVLPEEDISTVLKTQFNNIPLLDNWVVRNYDFHEFGKGKSKKPDIWIIGGALALRADLKEQVFSFPNKNLEFLPIRVAQEDWYIVNCLMATKSFDRDESVLYSGSENQIFMIIHVVITDPSLEKSEMFVLDGSNRTTLLIFPSLVERISALRLNGISFREIGYVRPGVSN